MKKVGKVLLIIALILVLLLALAYGALQGLLGHGPFRFLNTMYLKSLPGNAEIYRPENVAPVENSPLSGMNLCFLGSSVTEGAASLETSFAEYIAVRNNCTYVKEAVGGTTLADNDKTSYIQRMLHNIDPNAQFDAFICQLSTNDASNAIPLGEISSSRNLEDFDTKTVLGALEYIIVYADTTWHCPVVFYTGTQYDSPAYGKMVNAKHFDRVRGLIDPAKVVLGGRADEASLKIEPTILDGVDPSVDAVMQEEIFGPVLPVITYKSLDEVERFIMDRPTPLALYIFSEDRAVQQRFTRYVPFGGGCVNDCIMHLATSHMGFGGMGESGMGQYHGRESFDTFSHKKSIVSKATFFDAPFRYAPYAGWKDTFVRFFVH